MRKNWSSPPTPLNSSVAAPGAETLVHTARATENAYYVAVTAQRTSDDESVPATGIVVLTVTEYPDRGWLITKEDTTGM